MEHALELAKKLYDKVGKAKIKREVAAGALGYSGITGASLTMLGALNQYGLTEQDQSGAVGVSSLAIKILHPVSEKDANEAKACAALTPRVFNGLYTDGFHHCDEAVVANTLIQSGFTPDNAKRVAAVYLSNISFTNQAASGINKPSDAKKDEKKPLEGMEIPPAIKEFLDGGKSDEKPLGKKMLAQYLVPLGANEATITFTGEKLSADDFTALGDYVNLFKAQFERKQRTESSNPIPPKPAFPEPPLF